jgi:hypothetical protein
MHILLYVFCAVCVFSAVSFVVAMPFERSFSLSELDNLEILVLASFLFVTVRFFKRNVLEELTFWLCLKRYAFISSFTVILFLALNCVFLMVLLSEKGEIGRSDLFEYLDFKYFLFSGVYIFVLYAFSPLPTLAWFQNFKDDVKEDIRKSEGKEKNTQSTSDQSDFYTDSEGKTKADSVNIDAVDLDSINEDSSEAASFNSDKK